MRFGIENLSLLYRLAVKKRARVGVQVMAKLNRLPGVKAVPHDDDLKDRQAHSRIWNETWLSAFFHKPCNHELFVLQSLNMEGAPLSSPTLS